MIFDNEKVYGIWNKTPCSIEIKFCFGEDAKMNQDVCHYKATCVLLGGVSICSQMGAEVPQAWTPGQVSGSLPLAPE